MARVDDRQWPFDGHAFAVGATEGLDGNPRLRKRRTQTSVRLYVLIIVVGGYPDRLGL